MLNIIRQLSNVVLPVVRVVNQVFVAGISVAKEIVGLGRGLLKTCTVGAVATAMIVSELVVAGGDRELCIEEAEPP